METERVDHVNILKNIKKVTNYPFLSTSLAVLVMVAFLGFRINDNDTVLKLVDVYLSEGVMQIEAPAYRDFLERRLKVDQQGSPESLHHYESLLEQTDHPGIVRVLVMDRRFYHYLVNDGPLFLTDSDYKNWRKTRDEKINPAIATLSHVKYGVSSGVFEWSSIITHSLTDYGVVRMVGYCLLLVGIACVIEKRVYRARLAMTWLVALSACSLLYVVVAAPGSPLWVGIAWYVMSMLGLLFAASWQDFRSVNRANLALYKSRMLATGAGFSMLIACWWQEFWLGYSDWAGMLCGGLAFVMAVAVFPLVVRQEEVAQAEANSERLEWAERTGLANAMQSIAALNFNQARQQLLALMREHPDSRIILEQLYCLEKLNPEGETFWACARKRVEFALRHNDYAMMCQLFADIQKGAVSKERARSRLKPDHYHQMMTVFLAHADLEKAEKAYLFLELAGDSHIIREACRLLLQEFKQRHDSGKAHQYQILLERMNTP